MENPDVILSACETLIAQGANAIAITTNVNDLPAHLYAEHFDGGHPNPVGGVEAIISYLITNRFKLPSAHAPLLNIKDLRLRQNIVDARSAAEMASLSGLACTLIGLHKAPQLTRCATRGIRDVLHIDNVLALVAPASSLGGIPMVYANKHGIPIIAVEDNMTVFDVTGEMLGLSSVIPVRNYLEAVGVIQAIKEGASLESLCRPLKTLRHSSTVAHMAEQSIA